VIYEAPRLAVQSQAGNAIYLIEDQMFCKLLKECSKISHHMCNRRLMDGYDPQNHGNSMSGFGSKMDGNSQTTLRLLSGLLSGCAIPLQKGK
jgi:hypothetical protein